MDQEISGGGVGSGVFQLRHSATNCFPVVGAHIGTPAYRLNCGSATLGHTFIQLSKISPGNKVPLALGRIARFIALNFRIALRRAGVNQVLSQCCHSDSSS